MRFSIITCLFFLVLFIQPVAAEEAELELEMGLVKIMRAGKPWFSTKGLKNPLYSKTKSRLVQFKAQSGYPEKMKRLSWVPDLFGLDNLTEDQTQVSLLTGKGQFKVTPRNLPVSL